MTDRRTVVAGTMTDRRRTVVAGALSLVVVLWLVAGRHGETVRMLLRGGRSSCEGLKWVDSDVGWMDVGRVNGLSIDKVCQGKVWEPHVAKALGRYLHGQGVALDVGAFAGYHALRMARLAPAHNVYVFEGRAVLHQTIRRNARRNNLNNLVLVSAPDADIADDWQFPLELQREILAQKAAHPVALIKIDCEGCELNFLRGARALIDEFHPAMVLEIKDDNRRQTSIVSGQTLHKPAGTRDDVLRYLRKELGYEVTQLRRENGDLTWDFEAIWWPSVLGQMEEREQ